MQNQSILDTYFLQDVLNLEQFHLLKTEFLYTRHAAKHQSISYPQFLSAIFYGFNYIA